MAERDTRFEFGEIKSHDLALIRRSIGNSAILGEGPPPKGILQTNESDLDAVEVAAGAFAAMRSMFNSTQAKNALAGYPVKGIMTNAEDLNASAMTFQSREQYLIVMHSGVMFHPLVWAYRLAGYYERELGGVVTLATSSYVNDHEFPIPASIERRRLPMKSAMYATVALFCHELAHCFRGHLGPMRKRGVARLHAGPVPGQAVTIENRAIEVDADETAGRFLADIFFSDSTKTRDLLDNAEALRRFEVLARGVLLAFSVTERMGKNPSSDSIYFSGETRTYVLLSALLLSCTRTSNDSRRASSYITEFLDKTLKDMAEAGIPPKDTSGNFVSEAQDLQSVIAYRDTRLTTWLGNRPAFGNAKLPRWWQWLL